ncbi:amino acid-binding ACT domain protein [Ruminiclostridium papyrosolvens DSM 2782]|uniref:aspartate kinase n=1 Tax=Ruminiclostridium papyrosolvens DSM 2782 TaxID=588581 RepID=F1THA1_9FIRM|nr:ACT domain-containing protein [Ruminiclostridium papyrosolvens]EGD46104.1 amino acid-binding ACT domain protein [Ruminiclostridium papyrosolvens DSM 2782]WES35889.1 ACT domain-containing protein [Ruminiclostridium papyrosolvens DSM 2782]
MTILPVTSISTVYNVALVAVDNLPNDMVLIAGIFNKIADENINIDMISQSPPYKGKINIYFSIPADNIIKVITILNSFKIKVPNLRIEVDSDSTKISVFGEGMRDKPGVAAKVFALMADNEIEIKLITTSEVDISYLIYEKDADKAINAIRQEFNI